MSLVARISRLWTQEAIGMWRNSNGSGEPIGNSIPNVYGGLNFTVLNSRGSKSLKMDALVLLSFFMKWLCKCTSYLLPSVKLNGIDLAKLSAKTVSSHKSNNLWLIYETFRQMKLILCEGNVCWKCYYFTDVIMKFCAHLQCSEIEIFS